MQTIINSSDIVSDPLVTRRLADRAQLRALVRRIAELTTGATDWATACLHGAAEDYLDSTTNRRQRRHERIRKCAH